VSYRIGIKNRAGTRMAIFEEVSDPDTSERRLDLAYQHPSVDADKLTRLRRLAEKAWHNGRPPDATQRPHN
jgi:hypothetical protein